MSRRSSLATTVAGPARLLVCLALLAGAAASVWAAPPRPLPPFELASLEGGSVSAEALARDTGTCTAPAAGGEDCRGRGRWLLVYVSPYSGASDPMLHALEGPTGAGPRLVIVVAAEAAAAK